MARQISQWRCEHHPQNRKKLITAGRATAPVCDLQTEDNSNWPCGRTMVRFTEEPTAPAPSA